MCASLPPYCSATRSPSSEYISMRASSRREEGSRACEGEREVGERGVRGAVRERLKEGSRACSSPSPTAVREAARNRMPVVNCAKMVRPRGSGGERRGVR